MCMEFQKWVLFYGSLLAVVSLVTKQITSTICRKAMYLSYLRYHHFTTYILGSKLMLPL